MACRWGQAACGGCLAPASWMLVCCLGLLACSSIDPGLLDLTAPEVPESDRDPELGDGDGDGGGAEPRGANTTANGAPEDGGDGMAVDPGSTPGRDAGQAPGGGTGETREDPVGGDGDGDAVGAADDDAGVGDADPEPACQSSALDDYCSALPALPQPAVIDGVLDCGVLGRSLSTTTWNGSGAIPGAHIAKLAVAHRAEGLYVHVEVRGQAPVVHPMAAPIYCGDVVELYVDADGVLDAAGDYDDPGTMQIIVAAPASEASPDAHAERFLRGSSQGPWTGDFAVQWLADGYTVEALVRAADLGLTTWTPSTRVGLDVAIGVAGASDDPALRCGRLLGQYFLRVGSAVTGCSRGEPWCNASAFCAPTLE